MKLSGWLFILGTSVVLLIFILASIDRSLVGEVFVWVLGLMGVAVLTLMGLFIALIGLFIALIGLVLALWAVWTLWEKIELNVSKTESAKARHKARHMDSLPQPYEDDEGRSWANLATFEIFEDTVSEWNHYWVSDWQEIVGLEKGDITVEVFEERFSADNLRSSELGFLIHQNSETRHWDLGESDHDLQIYRDLWDYDQLSERFVEWFENEYPCGIETFEPDE